MYKIIIKILLISSLLTMPKAGYTAADVWTGWYPVGEVYTYSDGTLFISLLPTSAHSNPAGCAYGSWMRVAGDQINFKEIYQMALTAQASGLKLNANISGTECVGTYPKLFRLKTRR